MLLVHRLANTLRLCPQDLSSGSGRHVKIHLKIWRKKQMVCYGALKKKPDWQNIHMECLKILSYLMFFCIAKYFAKYCEWLKCHFFHALETHPEPHTYTKSLLASNKEASRSKTTAYLTLTWPEDRRKNLAIHLDQDLTSHWVGGCSSHLRFAWDAQGWASRGKKGTWDPWWCVSNSFHDNMFPICFQYESTVVSFDFTKPCQGWRCPLPSSTVTKSNRPGASLAVQLSGCQHISWYFMMFQLTGA